MTVVIVGPGAIGSLTAALLSRGPKPVVLLDHDRARAELVDRQGVRVEGEGGETRYRVRCTADYGCLSTAEFIIVAVKAYHTGAAAESLSRYVNLDSIRAIVTLQNGLGNVEVLQQYFPPSIIGVGATYHAATYLGPGRILHAGSGPTLLAPVSAEGRPRLLEFKRYLEDSGVDVGWRDDFTSLLWSKLVVNCAINPVTALTRLRNGEAAERPGIFRVMRDLALEAFRVALAVGATPDYEDPVAKVLEVARSSHGNRSSMLQDIERGRRTEVDYLNGAVVSAAERLGIPVPMNEAIYSLVKGLEASLLHG
jgi:2-dehydropantoate 2-reductase